MVKCCQRLESIQNLSWKNLFTPLLRWADFRNTVGPKYWWDFLPYDQICFFKWAHKRVMCDTFLGYLNTFLSDSRTFFSGANWGAIVIPKPKLPPQICLGQYSQSQTTASDQSETVFPVANYRFRSLWDSILIPKLPLQICLRQYSQVQTSASYLSETVFPVANYCLRSLWDSILIP